MKESRKHKRGFTNDYFLVFDMDSGQIIGRLLNLSNEGLMLISEGEIEINKIFKCRMILPDFIEGCKEIYFDIQSRWSQRNKRAFWFETGYVIIKKSEVTEKVLHDLNKNWMNEIKSDFSVE